MSRTVSARVPDEEFEKILEYSNQKGISINQFLKLAIYEKIKEQTHKQSEKKNPQVGLWLEDLKQEVTDKDESKQRQFEQLGKFLGLT